MGRGSSTELLDLALAVKAPTPEALTIGVADAFAEISGTAEATTGFCEIASRMLCAALEREGHEAFLVYGDVIWPDGDASAHCWARHGDLILDPTAGQFGHPEAHYVGSSPETARFTYEAAGEESGTETLFEDVNELPTETVEKILAMAARYGFRLSSDAPEIRRCAEGEIFCWADGGDTRFVQRVSNGAWSENAIVLNAYECERLLGSLVFHREDRVLVIESLYLKPGALDSRIERLLAREARKLAPAAQKFRCLYPEDEHWLKLIG